MAMMEDMGTDRARVAISLLEKIAAEGPVSAELVSTGGLRVLVQMMVLHPEPPLRIGACAVLSAAILQAGDNEEFRLAVKSARLAHGLQRVLHEDDRKAKPPEGEEQPVDPELPLRRVAFLAFRHLVGKVPGVLDDPAVAATVLVVVGSNDPEIRRGAVSFALSLASDQTKLPRLLAASEFDTDKAAAALLRAWSDHERQEDEDTPTVRESVTQLLLALRPSEPLRDHLAWAGALDIISSMVDENGGGDASGVTMFAELRQWISEAPPREDSEDESTHAEE